MIIHIQGLKRTRPFVVREMFPNDEHQSIENAVQCVEDGVQKLRALNVFETVHADIIQKENGVLEVTVHIKEKQLGSIRLGASSSTLTTNSTDLAVEAEVSGRSCLGCGEMIHIMYQKSAKANQQVRAMLQRPCVLGSDLCLSLEARDAIEETPYAPATSTYLGQSQRVEEISAVLSDPKEKNSFRLGIQTQSKTYVLVRWLFYDTRDSVLTPTQGSLATANVQIALPILGSISSFTKCDFAWQRHWIFNYQIVLSLSSGLGLVSNDKIVDNSHLNNQIDTGRFYLGGSTLRGFEAAGIGSRFPPSEPIKSRPSPSRLMAFLGSFFFSGTETTQESSAFSRHRDRKERRQIAGAAHGGQAFATTSALLSFPLFSQYYKGLDDTCRGHLFLTMATLLPDITKNFLAVKQYSHAATGFGLSITPGNMLRIEFNYAAFFLTQPGDLTKRYKASFTTGFG